MVEKTDIAYLAGIIDGEGYIGIKKSAHKNRVTPGYHARIQIRMVDEPAIAFLAGTLGGSYYYERPHAAKGRPLYCFQASDAQAEHILRTVRPFLRVKAIVADVVLELRKHMRAGRKHCTKPNGERILHHWGGKDIRVTNFVLSDECVAERQKMYERCKELNRTGI